MSVDFAVEYIRQAILMTLLVASPLLIISLIVGVTVSIIQAVTQVQEQTLTFIPKILAVGTVFLLMLPWIASRLIAHLVGAISTMSTLGN
jgi:flagellar biosynthetic protein FliQ